MKLIYCQECRAVLNLRFHRKYCDCKKCGGYYESNGSDAHVWGPCIALGFANGSFLGAMRDINQDANFNAFAIPPSCKTITRHETEPTKK